VRAISRNDAAARVKRALDMVRLPGMESRMPGQLSGGQQQRVAVARALVFEPQLILMDEPLGALDKQLREEMQLELRGLHERLGITTVYVTHDQSEALTMSDRIAVFHQGRIQQIADPKTIYELPANLFVASFIGENNRLAGEVIDRDADGGCVAQVAGGVQLRGRATTACSVPTRATVSVRPERIAVSAPSAAPPGANALPGRIEETIFLGGHVRVRLKSAAGELVASVPIQDAGAIPPEGAPAVAHWPAASTVVFPQ
jgi:putative spermidine/putrescine transport system ATP-binding protein